MKVCLSNNQISSYLSKANEISFRFDERNKIIDTYEKYPEADMVLFHYDQHNPVVNWDELEEINILTKQHFILALNSLSTCHVAKKLGIKFFYNQKVTSFLEANALKELGSCYIIPGEPIFFQMDVLKRKGIPIRVIPNLVNLSDYLYDDGVLGTWIRPEDMFLYKNYIDCIEFFSADGEIPSTKERGLYRVYIEDQEWNEELGLLITGFNHKGFNGLIDSEWSTMRLNCGQACQRNSHCNICYKMLDIANKERLEAVLNNSKN